jgi:hypothetical protein
VVFVVVFIGELFILLDNYDIGYHISCYICLLLLVAYFFIKNR